MTACEDCGARRGGLLCEACARTAMVLGFTAADTTFPSARVEQQRVMIPHVAAPMMWRAVCDHHDGADWPVAAWQSSETHDDWIQAAIDAREHDALEHDRPLGARS